jgi:ABC-type maltose transport system permease subunit
LGGPHRRVESAAVDVLDGAAAFVGDAGAGQLRRQCFPLILTQSPDKRVLPLFVWSFQGEFTINIPAILAAVVLSTLPISVLYVLGRRQLVGGLTAGFGK